MGDATVGTSAAVLTGRCTCGEVGYRLTHSPLFVHCCHCTWCQRETGSAFAVNVLVETAHVKVEQGRPEAVPTPSASGRGQQIVRCPRCHVALWSHYPGMGPSVSFVRAGTLDQPSLVKPDIHIHVSSSQPWVRLPDDVPRVQEYYDAREYWPEASRQRYRSLQGASP